MKKAKKISLTLNRETLRALEEPEVAKAEGGADIHENHTRPSWCTPVC